jgi:hypothetical protein
MTALKKYQRLECGGLWRPGAEAQRRDVVVSFGEASLIIADARSEVPLAHWSLPAVARRNPGETPALYSPDADAGETLELDDPDMIGALETVARSLRRGSGGRSRLRRALPLVLLLAGLGAGALWLPGALVAHAVRVLPQATQVEIGLAVLADLERAGHPVCGAPLGLRALGRLQERLAVGLEAAMAAGTGPGRLVVLAGREMAPALALPGGILALGQPLIEAHDSPEVAAGHALAARAAAAADDPLAAALRDAGLRAVVVLLTTGVLPERALRGHGVARMAAPPPPPSAEVLLPVLAAAGVAAAPYARALPDAAEATALILGDPFADAAPPPLLSDGDWVSLQGICRD